MRPPAVEKLGYYPTDEPVIDILTTYITSASEKARLFDPCAGEGIAAAKLGRALNCATWGVELSPARAAKAGQVMDRVFQAPWQACFLSNESISMLFLNPPYESSEDHKRVELEFLSSTTTKLVRGGLLIYIVPQHILGLVQVARILAGQYECLTVGRFPDGLFEKFKQLVVLGYRRKSYTIPTEAEIEAIQAWAKVELDPLAPLSKPIYHLIPSPERGLDGRPVIFKRTDWEAEDVVEATTTCGFQRTKEWLDLIQPDHNRAELTQPVMPLKKGHVAMLMASGMMGTVRLTDDEGRPMLIKGRVVKKVEKVGEEGIGEEVTETYRDRFVTTVAVLKQDKIEVIQDIQGLVPFMKAYGEKIAAHVMKTYRPLYNFDSTSQEIQVLDRLGQERKPLPGQDRPGLLPTQRHAAAALARCIRKHGVANCQAEMGSGKTTVASAVVDLLNAYPALIICPPHLVPKWIREVEEVIPGVHAREIRRIGRNAEDPGDINDVRAFLEDYDAGRIGKKAVAVVANTAAKFGAGWKPAAMRKRTVDPLTGQHIWAYACPTCGTVIDTEENGVIVPVTDLEQLAKKRHFCRAMVSGWQLNPDGTRKLDADGNSIWGTRLCKTPLFAFTATRRESIANYIAKHQNGAFEVLVADECLVKDTLIETKVGPKAIQDIRVGDEVLSYNHESNALEYKKVLHTMKNPAPNNLVRTAGIVCTANHPIFTEEDHYVEAQALRGKTLRLLRKDLYDLPQRQGYGSLLLSILRIIRSITRVKEEVRRCTSETDGRKNLPAVWESILSSTNGSVICEPKVLLTQMQCGSSLQEHRFGARVRCKNAQLWKWLEWEEATRGGGADGQAQSNARSGKHRKSKESEHRKNIPSPRRQWNDHQTAGEVSPGTWAARISTGIRHIHQQCQGIFSLIADSLQSGSGYSGGESGNRSRWSLAQEEEMEIPRPTEDSRFESLRVDRVEILERGNRSGFEQVCPDGYVYNLEVEANNNYFANGILVHNCHQFKGKSSDRGLAFHQLVTACKSTLTLTGTFFGGKSTSIFWLLHRLNAGVRRDFAFNEELRWARLYGVLETKRKRRRDDADEDGVFTGNRRYRNNAKEQPGISPAIINRLLDTTIFLSLKDLGLALPAYNEEVTTLEMLEEQSSQYQQMESTLKSMALQSNRYLSTWLQWSLARPNSAFREETIMIDEAKDEKGKVVRKVPLMVLPPVVNGNPKWLPKEGWLADFCRNEKRQGRKVLVYVRQTGTRDIVRREVV